jgi:hypothetical protein
MNSKFTNARIVFNTEKTSSIKQKPFCKVCYDANQKGYDTHYVRSKVGADSVVVCPYLLSLECGYCHDIGHTVKYCPALASRETQSQTKTKPQTKTQIQTHSSDKYQSRQNVTSSVDDDGWTCVSKTKSIPGKFRIVGLDETPTETPTVACVSAKKADEVGPEFELWRDFPTLKNEGIVFMPQSHVPSGSSWASIAATKPKPVVATRNMVALAPANVLVEAIDVAVAVAASKKTIRFADGHDFMNSKYAVSSNWADESSDDDGGSWL